MFRVKKETQVRERIIAHVAQTHACLVATRSMFEAYLEHKIKPASEALAAVREAERQADTMRREIYRLLGAGAFLPILRADLHKLVAQVDELAGMAEDLGDLMIGEKPKLPARFNAPLKQIFAITLDQFNDLENLLNFFFLKDDSRSKTIEDKIHQISAVEHLIDGIEWDLTVSLFSSRMALAEKLHFKRALTQLTGLSNKIEDISDTLSELTVKLQA